jgi:hypothetical protein
MYRNNTHTVKELRNEIVSVFIRITADILCWVFAIFHCQLLMVLDDVGPCIENVLHWQVKLTVLSRFTVLSSARVMPVH